MYENVATGASVAPTAARLREKARLHLNGNAWTMAKFVLVGLLLTPLIWCFIVGIVVAILQWIFEMKISLYIICSVIFIISTARFSVGIIKLSLDAARGKTVYVKDGFVAFDNFRYILRYMAVLIVNLLWYVVFIIPGIIKTYAHSMTFYVMHDNPETNVFTAMEKSEELMEGNKWRYFCLQISFIGWNFLAYLTFGLLNFWLIPYMSVAFAEFYEDLKARCVKNKNIKVSNSTMTKSDIPKQEPTAQNETAAINGGSAVKIKSDNANDALTYPTVNAEQILKQVPETKPCVKIGKEEVTTPTSTKNTNENIKENTKMEENKEVIRETFLTAATNILTENGIDGTIDTLTYRKIKFDCNKRPVLIGINVDERFIFCTTYKYINGFEQKTTSTVAYKVGNEEEFTSIVEGVLYELCKGKRSSSTKFDKSSAVADLDLGRMATAADFNAPVGTSALEIFDEGCKYWFKKEKKGYFGPQQILYATNATCEGYSVWFLTHGSLTEPFGKCKGNWWNVPYANGYIEEYWKNPTVSDGGMWKDHTTRVTYIKTKNGYVFAGIYIPYDEIKTKVIDGTTVWVKTYRKVSDVYPEKI